MTVFNIVKFSDNTIKNGHDWLNVKAQIGKCLDANHLPVVVFSAFKSIMPILEDLIRFAYQGNNSCETFSATDLKTRTDKLKERYMKLAEQLLSVDKIEAWDAIFQEIDRLLLGISLTKEATPRLKARLVNLVQKLTSNLGYEYLKRHFADKKIYLLEATSVLQTTLETNQQPVQEYLEASFSALKADPNLQSQLSEYDIIVTQGGIAANSQNEPVLLGRDGSDLSTAALGLKLQAEKVDFWSDLPGFYTADPHLIPSARLLRHLDYEEAQELASAGLPIVSPIAISILAESHIPIYVHCSEKPELEGTCISDDHSGDNVCVKALTASTGITLVSLNNINMWQQVGFLAKIFNIFAKHNLSIDLVATSQSNVTVSLDNSTDEATAHKLKELLQDLSLYCSPKLIAPCAALSLVGRKMRSNLHKLGPTLEIFEEEKVHLLSQAASDLNFTFVVDQTQAERLLKTLHAQLFSGIPDPQIFGASFRQEFLDHSTIHKQSSNYNSVWWIQERQKLLSIEKTPAYVYHKPTLVANAQTLLNLSSVDKVFFAIKANSNREILKIFAEQGLGFECVSVGELERVRSLFPNLPTERLLFTPNFASGKDFSEGFKLGAMVTLDNVQPLKLWPDIFKGREVLLRLDLGHGSGHSRKVRTAGNFSKFGIPLTELAEVSKLTKELKVTVIGLHSHSGSGIKTPDTWAQAALNLSECAELFPTVKYLDLGGGLGVPERRDLDTLDLNSLDQRLLLFKNSHPQYKIMIEPGRFLVAQAGIILTKVSQTKRKGDKLFIGCDAGMQTLIRPALYGAYHEIVNLSRWGELKSDLADIVGPICETGDTLGRDRRIEHTKSGDMLLIDTAGAYGFTMSSNYNLRPQAEELIVSD